MPLEGLNHYTIRPVDLERTRQFYEDVLGLHVGYRPPLNFPGYWLYVGDNPTVHLIGPRADDAHPKHRRIRPDRAARPHRLHLYWACRDEGAAGPTRHQARGAGDPARPADPALHP
ncbi:VOC family protein [Dankookia sp. P2]|uniref:VOC family protein n=1 Tax=Dankookia sp. P2 TaxID=3423955 RepID=UPI003D664057